MAETRSDQQVYYGFEHVPDVRHIFARRQRYLGQPEEHMVAVCGVTLRYLELYIPKNDRRRELPVCSKCERHDA